MAGWTVVLLDLTLEAVSGVRIGGSRSDNLGTDAPILRDPSTGRPLLPGSSLKGVLRSSAERMLAGQFSTSGRTLACDIIQNYCGGPPGSGSPNGNVNRPPDIEPLLASLCHVCRLFGSPHAAARLSVGDLTADDSVLTTVRDGVGINRNELKAEHRLKYDYEVIAPGSRFNGRIRVDDPEPGDLGLLLALLDLVDLGVVTVGGGASRGLGRLRVILSTARRLDAATWQPGDAAGSGVLSADDLAAARVEFAGFKAGAAAT